MRRDAGHDGGTPLDAGPPPPTLDERLAAALADETVPVTALMPESPPAEALVTLGEALFYDPILSGNQDVACASCHQGSLAAADGLPLNLGTGTTGLGAARGEDPHPPWGRRHTPELWNRGGMERLFWDGRVSRDGDEVSAQVVVPDGLGDPLAIQALHPILDPAEMLGAPGDTRVDGSANELAGRADLEVYAGLEARLTAIEAYVTLFRGAFGDEPITITNVVRAIAAFERARYAATDTPWDRYLRGEVDALSGAQKLGAIVFFSPNGCSGCHSGPLLTDEAFHNIGVPLLEPVDEGRFALTDEPADRYAFRTPPLRNVAVAPPFMHNGIIGTLDDAIAHYGRPLDNARTYEPEHLPADLAARHVSTGSHVDAMLGTLSSDLVTDEDALVLIQVSLSNLLAFMMALVDEVALEGARQVPESVPSGLPVGGG